jgi:hypothetical protein
VRTASFTTAFTAEENALVTKVAKKIIDNRQRFATTLRILDAITDVLDDQNDPRPLIQCFAPNKFTIYVRELNKQLIRRDVYFAIRGLNFAARMKLYSRIVSQIYQLNQYGVLIKSFYSIC